MEKQKIASIDNLIPLFRERLASGQSVCFSPQGTSMLPMLRQGIDSVVISPLPEKIKKYDIVLYQRESGQYVLHRVVEVKDTYTFMGDNQFVKEYGLKQEQLIAVVTSFTRNKKSHKTNEIGYWVYCRLWYHSRLVRRFLRRCINWLKYHIGGKQ